MARPRVFVSSTFYDLKYIRQDLEYFIKEMGYDPILNERGTIAYGSAERLEEYAYKEIEHSDILVAIVGGRFGSASHHLPYSISNVEVRTALDRGKQVYIFIERSVWSEYATYLHNKGSKDTRYRFVDDNRVYAFIEELEALPRNNTIATFESSRDITDYLKEQWAGLFQRFLNDQVRLKEVKILEAMRDTAKTLDQLVGYLTQNKDQTIKEILLNSHPAFTRLRQVTGVPYRLFFSTHDELKAWLAARNFRPVEQEFWDSEHHEEWISNASKVIPNSKHKSQDLLKFSTGLFDADGRLRVVDPSLWKDDQIVMEQHITDKDGNVVEKGAT